ncbi:MAG: hypothetical protein HY585_03585 [Candidatus Omnitrophica bacterium]|nr:hypothetical protein [Candidatus Omnitrophota bacterium]
MMTWASKLTIVFFAAALFFILAAAYEAVRLPLRIGFPPRIPSADEILEPGLGELKPLSHYEREFAAHTLFARVRPETGAPVATFAEQLSKYSLTGLVQGDQPEAIIQDKTTQQIHFVQIGESFDEFTLIEIKPHSVVVEFHEDRAELTIGE